MARQLLSKRCRGRKATGREIGLASVQRPKAGETALGESGIFARGSTICGPAIKIDAAVEKSRCGSALGTAATGRRHCD